MTTLIHNESLTDTDLVGSRLGRIDPDIFRNQGLTTAGPSSSDDDDEELSDDETDEDLFDEPADEDGDPTGEHDHHQDDNYALGGHVTRSGSV